MMRNMMSMLSILFLVGCGPANADEQHGRRRTDFDGELRRLRERLAQPPTNYVEQARREDEARLARWHAREADFRARVSRLQTSMHDYFIEAGGSDRLARRIDLDGFAVLVVRTVETRVEQGEWVPLDRDKAAAFLAAVAFHESSWRWMDAGLRGSRGERCAFQVSDSAARIVGANPTDIARDPAGCIEAALDVMDVCRRRCGDQPAERWFGCYASAGQCGAAPDVVGERFETARRLLGRAEK